MNKLPSSDSYTSLNQFTSFNLPFHLTFYCVSTRSCLYQLKLV